jgi:hypothetical protein
MRALVARMRTQISKLTDAELIDHLRRTCAASDRLLGEMILLLIDVERRRLYLEEASPSLFDFCLRKLRMSEGEAFRRIRAARLVSRFPALLAYIERRDIHLSALMQLRDHFTEENVHELVMAARGKNKMEIAELVARLAPRADVPAKVRKLPQHDARTHMTKASRPSIDPLSESRYRLQMTGSRRFRDKLFRARDLMMHSNPSGDLAVVVERAIDELLEVLEKRVYGKLSAKPRVASSPPEAESADASSEPSKNTRRTSTKKTGDTPGPGLMRTSSESVGTTRDASRRRHQSHPTNGSIHLRQRKSRGEATSEVGQGRSVPRAHSG